MTNVLSMIFGLINHKILVGVSGTNFDPKSNFDVRFVVALQKARKNCEKLIIGSEAFAKRTLFGIEIRYFVFVSPTTQVRSTRDDKNGAGAPLL